MDHFHVYSLRGGVTPRRDAARSLGLENGVLYILIPFPPGPGTALLPPTSRINPHIDRPRHSIAVTAIRHAAKQRGREGALIPRGKHRHPSTASTGRPNQPHESYKEHLCRTAERFNSAQESSTKGHHQSEKEAWGGAKRRNEIFVKKS